MNTEDAITEVKRLDPTDESIIVIKLAGMWKEYDMQRFAHAVEREVGKRALVIDSHVEYIALLKPRCCLACPLEGEKTDG